MVRIALLNSEVIRVMPSPPLSAPQTEAFQAFEQNLNIIGHILALQRRELAVIQAGVTRLKARSKKALDLSTQSEVDKLSGRAESMCSF
jgi:hypothetical protein